MNKIVKALLAIFGGINVVFNIFTPISISLILVSMLELPNLYSSLLLIFGGISSLYRGIEVGFLRIHDRRRT